MTVDTKLRDRIGDTTDPPSVLIVSDWHLGTALASELRPTHEVRLVTDHDRVAGQAPDDVRVVVGDGRDIETLRSIGATDVDAAIVATRTDHRNLLVTQLLRTQFDLEKSIVMINDPTTSPAFEDIATETVCVPTFLATGVHSTVETALQTVKTA